MHVVKPDTNDLTDDALALKARRWEDILARPILGTSRVMANLRTRIERVAKSDVTVLITGETGTGKELVATNLHAGSHRNRGQFLAVNCGSITETLAETTLFGYVKGAYTDAREDRPGLFEQAVHGTLFLDEVGEMAQGIQTHFLRVLETSKTRRVGGRNDITVDVRVIAATNRNLNTLQYDGQFRADLFHRLSVVTIDVPPLRKHKEDIPELAAHFLREFAEKYRKRVDGFADGIVQSMVEYGWPGNVRELANTIESAVAEHQGGAVLERDAVIFGQRVDNWQEFKAVRIPETGIPLEEIERQAILEALRMCFWVQKDAAELLSISPRVMNYKIKTLAIEVRDWRKWKRGAD